MPETNSLVDTISEETGGKIVDFADFEHQKENIQPLRRGRSAAALSQIYGGHEKAQGLCSTARHSLQPHRPLAERKPEAPGMESIKVSSHLEAQNAEFQREIASMDPVEADDPLDVYYRYVKWLLEVFPQAHGHQTVIRMVEQPLKQFRGQERYRNDARFIKMWIWYTSIIGDGQEAVFQFLVANRIGDSLAIMYEEYAKLLEGAGKVRKADEIYQLGIARKAQPLARLQRRFDEFQRRVMARTMRDVDARQSGQEPRDTGSAVADSGSQRSMAVTDENAYGNSQRTMLGTKRSGRSVRSAAANKLPQSQRGLPDHSESMPARPNARIQVFLDPEGCSENQSVLNAAGDSAGPWRDIGTDESRRKENLPEATSWRGQKLQQRPVSATHNPAAVASAAGPASAAPAKFTVFSDNDTSQHQSSSTGSILAAKDEGSMVSASGLLQTFEGTSKPKKHPKSKDKPKAAERMVMPAEMLFPNGDGVPQCAEEARAQLARYRYVAEEKPEVDSEEGSDDEGIIDESGFGKHKRRSMAASSPTINTKVAQKDMLDIWNNLSDSDSDSLLGMGGGLHQDGSAGSSKRRQHARDASWKIAADDDYQFTMGPVTPNVVPRGGIRPVIPTSAQPSRVKSAAERSKTDENDDINPPTMVLNSIRAAKRREMQQSRHKPTPLAARVQTPRQQASMGQNHMSLRSIEESSEAEDSNEDESLMRVLTGTAKTPMSARIPVFSDEQRAAYKCREERPKPLFAGTDTAANGQGKKSPLLANEFECEYPPVSSRPSNMLLHSTPARYPQTPGTMTRTASNGGEFTALSGLTGMSTVGSATASTFMAQQQKGAQTAIGGYEFGEALEANENDDDDDDEDDDDEDARSIRSAQTPMRKRLSMAARDLGRITPRFPKTPPGGVNQQYVSDNADDDDDDDAEDDDDPCTENIGEFADLDSQMNELQMELGAQFLRSNSASSNMEPNTDSKRSAPLFSIFRDE
ncbi:protein kinase [Coemansia sp. RSA 1086]|nr:protein kinase [Coemansia sp. RSA 1086]